MSRSPTEADLAHARELHARAVVIATHTDFCPDVGQRQRAGEEKVFSRRHAPVLRRGGVSGVCDHVAGDASYLIDFPFRNTLSANRLKFGLQGITAMLREASTSPEEMVIATSVEQILDAKRSGRIAVVLCFEGASPLEDDLGLLESYRELGIRVIGLTHDARNLLGDGIRTGAAGGLTDFGRQAVREMNRLGIVVDVSHLNEAGFWDVVRVSQAPIHASHSNCATLCPTPRNLTDDQLHAIAESGGVVGIHGLSRLISAEPEKATIDALVDHIVRMVDVMGEDHVAIGPDLMENYPEEEYRFLWRSAQLTKPPYLYPERFSSYADFPNITAELVARGFSDQSITKILGGNALRLFGAVWRS